MAVVRVERGVSNHDRDFATPQGDGFRRLNSSAARRHRSCRARSQTQKTRHGAGCSLGVKNPQTTRRAGAIAVVIGLKAVAKKLLYISPIFWDSATNVS
jgi:hypothetical protein